jgi:hydroxypyruvate isomerase
VIRTVTDNIKSIAHFHTGGVPGRHEIDDTQELNYRRVMKAIADTGFQGYVAQEFIPTKDPRQSLAEAVRICTV